MSRALFWILIPSVWITFSCGLGHLAAPLAAIVFTALIVAADRLAKLRSRPAFILL